MPGQPRHYRRWVGAEGLVAFEVREFETDLQILAERDLSFEALAAARNVRSALMAYIDKHEEFAETEIPFQVADDAPEIVRRMAAAARAAGVGPMAAVAGAIAESVGWALLERSSEVIVENGGDIFLSSQRERMIAIYAGRSKLSGRLGIRVGPDRMPVGVCTSSGTVGHSRSYGYADAACVIAKDTALADAVATALGNRVRDPERLDEAVEWATGVAGVTGALAILADKLAVAGDLELAKL